MRKKLDPTALLQKATKKLVSNRQIQYPDFRVGDSIKVHVRVTEGEKTRIQVFEGIVIGMKKGSSATSGSFTVRKISYAIGVERVFPFYSPVIEKVTLVSRGEVRRAKLYYLRALSGRASRIKSELVFGIDATGAATAPAVAEVETHEAPIQAKAVQA